MAAPTSDLAVRDRRPSKKSRRPSCARASVSGLSTGATAVIGPSDSRLAPALSVSRRARCGILTSTCGDGGQRQRATCVIESRRHRACGHVTQGSSTKDPKMRAPGAVFTLSQARGAGGGRHTRRVAGVHAGCSIEHLLRTSGLYMP